MTWGVPLLVSYHFTFSYCSRGSQGKNTEVVFAIPFSSGPHSDAGRDCGQEEKGTTEDEMAGWHHGLDGHESE